MRSFLLPLAGVLSLIGGCYGTSTDDSGETGVSGAGGSSAGSGSGGQARGGRTFGISGSSSAGSSSGGTGPGGGSSGGTYTGGTSCGPDCDGIICEGDNATLNSLDKSCETEADCIAVLHTTDCCGSGMIMGINADAEATFRAAEMQCAPLPVCDCAPQDTALEDGTRIPYGEASYVIACSGNTCQSAYPGTAFTCGEILCTETQYCTLVFGGQPDSGTTASCSALGDCKSCDCLPAGVGCGCSQDDAGNITVTCALP